MSFNLNGIVFIIDYPCWKHKPPAVRVVGR